MRICMVPVCTCHQRQVQVSQYITPRTENGLDNLVPHLPLWEVVQDLHSTDTAQEKCATAVDHADFYGSHPET